MNRIEIREESCKSCECVIFCPRELLLIDRSRINNLGYNPASFVDNPDKPAWDALYVRRSVPMR